MSATEKVLQNLIDSMHAKIAAGYGKKPVNTKKELENATEESKESAEEPIKVDGNDLFEKWLQYEKEKKPPPKKNQIVMTKATVIAQPLKKSKK